MNEHIDKAAEAFNAGKTILYPTDTVWGLGCDATNDQAVAEITTLKGRSSDKSYIVLVDSDVHLQRLVNKVPDVAWELIDQANKPLTLVLPDGKNVSSEVLADDGSIAIRITKNEFCSKLIKRVKRPLVSTSANISGQPTARSLEEVDPRIRQQVGHIVDLRPLQQEGKPSTIIKLGVDGAVTIIRS